MDIAISSWDENRLSFYKNKVGLPVSFTVCADGGADLQSDITGTTYRWQRQIGSGSFINLADGPDFTGTQTATLNFLNIQSSWNGNKFRCIADNSRNSSIFIMNVRTQAPVPISISASDTSICNSYTVNFNSIVPANNALSLTYEWLVNGQIIFNWTPDYYSNSLRNNDQVSCVLIAYDSCNNPHYDTSNVITMSVIGSPGSLVISTPSLLFCAGQSVTFTAATNYPDVPFLWYISGHPVTGVSGSTLTTSTLIDQNYISCYQVVDGCNVAGNDLTMTLTATCPCLNNTWLGTVSNAWENPGNWSCGTVPGPSSVVIINSGTVVVSSNATIYSLSLSPGVTFTVNTGFNMTIMH